MPSIILSDNGVSSGSAGIKTSGSNDGTLALQTTTAAGTATTAVSIDTSQNVSLPNSLSTGNTFGFKNRIINGDCRIDQYNAGATGTGTNNFPVDRWRTEASQSGKWTWGQNLNSVTPPAGFKYYSGISSSSAYSLGSGDYFLTTQGIEGSNCADLGFGASGAATFTLSFWVRSSLTGTFSGSLMNNTQSRCYIFTYTISAANTWEQKTITVAGDTSGTWSTTNTTGLYVRFSLGVGSTYSTSSTNQWVSGQYWSATGSTNVMGTNGATWYVTGVQVERGSQATSFDFRSYGTELALCQRYYQQYGGDTTYAPVAPLGTASSSSTVQSIFMFPVEMRATPSVAQSTLEVSDAASSFAVTAVGLSGSQTSRKGCNIYFDVASGLTQFRPYIVRTRNSTSSYLALSAEL